MVEYWEPGTQYDYGAVVIYQDVEYKIIQPHKSQSDWTPLATPALWGRMQGHHGHQNPQQWGDDCRPPASAPSYGQQPQCEKPQYEQPPQQQHAAPTQEGNKQHWYDGHKKELEIGGGLLAGMALLGAGYKAYKHHEQSEEDKNAQLWSHSTWVNEAQLRTNQFRNRQYNRPVAWVLVQGKSIPPDAIEGGRERGEPLYICRAYYEGGLMIGKASKVFKKGAVIGYKKEEIHLDLYEVLVGDSRAVRWVSVSGTFSLRNLGYEPVEGGREPGGALQYIAQAPFDKGVHPGKASEIFGDGAYIPYDNDEKHVKQYSVLCYVGNDY